jgi:hypothetical protein
MDFLRIKIYIYILKYIYFNKSLLWDGIFLEVNQTRRFPFFQEGMNPAQIHKDYRIKVIDLLIKEKKPINITQVSETLEIAWATADKILNELAREGKLRTFKMGTSNCFEINLSAITEILSSHNVARKIREVDEE